MEEKKLSTKETLNRNKDLLISTLFSESILTSGSGQTENTQIRVFAYFQFDYFQMSKIYFESRFEIKRSICLF